MSERIVKIDGKEVALRCSGATYIRYRNEFKKDLFVELQKFASMADGGLNDGAMETLLRATYVMAKQADKTITMGFEDWLDQFDLMGVMTGLEDALELITGSQLTLDEAKKNNNQPTEK